MTLAKRPGGGAVGSKSTGGINSARVGNTPTPAGNFDIDDAPGRHTTGGQVEFTSENLPVREHAVQAVDSSEDDVFPTQPRPAFFPEPHYPKGTTTLRANNHEPRVGNQPHALHPESDGGNNTYRGSIPRQEVQDAKLREGRVKQNEREQRGSNPRNQR